jgi:MFS family permease
MNLKSVWSYENRLLVILGLAFGICYFDRNAGTILVPLMEHDLQLNNTQVGFLGSGLSITWAIGAYLVARWSDAIGVRKPFLIAFLLIFSVCSFISGLAPNFAVLLASRMVMGAVEGPFLPVCLAIMAIESSERRRGVNFGLMQNFFASVLGQMLAPVVLVALADRFGWRSAFYVAGVPGLLILIAVLLWVREPGKAAQASVDTAGLGGTGARMGLFAMIGVRNIALCCLISLFMVAWLVLGWTFLPKFFTDYRHFSPTLMGYLMGSLGASSALSAFVVPAISDRLGRKPAMLAFCLVGALSPLAAIYFEGPAVVLAMLMFVGWMACGTFPLFMGVIPNETISRRYAATAMGIVVCVGEVVGGFGINSVAGVLADRFALTTPVLIQAACALCGAALCLALIETAPSRLRAAAADRLAAESLRREAS